MTSWWLWSRIRTQWHKICCSRWRRYN